MANQIIPAQSQPALPQDKFIIAQAPAGDVVPFDVAIVGAGPAGLATAIELARLAKADGMALEIGVLDKAGSLGGHTLSGAVINPAGLQALFPDLKIADFPFRKPVTEERVYLTTPKRAIRIPTPPTMKNHGYHVASLCEVVRWMGTKAEELGVNIMTGFPVDALLSEGQKVVGVRTTPAGLKRDGTPGAQGIPATDISARVTVLSDGSRSPLAQAYTKWQGIGSPQPQVYALGVKEIWKVKKAPNYILHTLGYPLPKDTFGGSWMYPMGDDQISIGLVAGLDYGNARLDVHNLLQHLKRHELFKDMLAGGTCVEWGAKTIPEGGYHAVPERLSGDGLVMTGDTLGLVNVPALKGVHYAMTSGIHAARAIFAALKADDVSQATLGAYDRTLRESFVFDDLREVRNVRHAFKSGFYAGGFKAALMTVTRGKFPGDGKHAVEDAAEPKTFDPPDFPTEKVGLSKVDAVYLSGNKTRDDIPSHLIVGQDVAPEAADFLAAMCPAGVYERHGDKLVVNAPNCVDCKATDVLGPRWSPREGGSGPDYKEM